MPDEYKAILKSFHEQGRFYKNLIQHVDKQGTADVKFWDLPSTLGFKASDISQPEWLASLINLNPFQEDGSISELFENLSEKIQPAVIKLHLNIRVITGLHDELSQRALLTFNELQNQGDEKSSEQLCADWLQAGEEAFNDISQGDNYIQAQHAVLEALSELTSCQQTMAEQLAQALGLPSQQNVQDLQKGLQQLRIEFAEYKEQTDVTINTLITHLSQK